MSNVAPPSVWFHPDSVLLIADARHPCAGASVTVHRQSHGLPHLVCHLLTTDQPHVTAGMAQPEGQLGAAACILSPADARALARELDRVAGEAEDE